MKVPDEALRVSYEVLTAVTINVNGLCPLEEPGEADPLGHACTNYIRKGVNNSMCTVCFTFPNSFSESWHEGPEGLVVLEPFDIDYRDGNVKNGPPELI